MIEQQRINDPIAPKRINDQRHVTGHHHLGRPGVDIQNPFIEINHVLNKGKTPMQASFVLLGICVDNFTQLTKFQDHGLLCLMYDKEGEICQDTCHEQDDKE